MVMKALYRRVSDRIPLGMECALPQIPTPPSLGRPRRMGVALTLALVLAALLFLLGAWQVGRGLSSTPRPNSRKSWCAVPGSARSRASAR